MDRQLAVLIATVVIAFTAITRCEVARLDNNDLKKTCLEKYQPEACAKL